MGPHCVSRVSDKAGVGAAEQLDPVLGENGTVLCESLSGDCDSKVDDAGYSKPSPPSKRKKRRPKGRGLVPFLPLYFLSIFVYGLCSLECPLFE